MSKHCKAEQKKPTKRSRVIHTKLVVTKQNMHDPNWVYKLFKTAMFYTKQCPF